MNSRKPSNQVHQLATSFILKSENSSEEKFDRIVRMGAHIFDVPIALISWIKADSHEIKACYGLSPVEASQAISFCQQALFREDPLIIPNAQLDSRFGYEPLVIKVPYIRFYAGLPLFGPDGSKLGTLGLMDSRLRPFSQAKWQSLKDLAAWAENEFLAEQQQQTIQRLQEVNHFKNEFLASISHELRTPLNAVTGYAEMLLTGFSGQVDDEARKDIQAIYANGQQLIRLVNDFLDISRIEAGRLALNPETIPVAKLLEEIKTNNASLFVKKPVKFIIAVEEGMTEIQADYTRLNQILNNLISNAIKFTVQGHVKISAFKKNGLACFEVEDTGIGIDEVDLPFIFEQFRQVDRSAARRAQGTGLGLTITRRLVDLHGGSIQVRSQPGQGTTFTVCLPAITSTEIPAPDGEPDEG